MRVAVFRLVAGAPNREFGSLSRIGCYTEKKRTISFEKSALDDKSLRAFYIWDGMMNALLEKYNDYLRLVGCTAEYELENGIILTVEYKRENFPHLIGLHKLKDIQLIQFWNDRSNRSIKLKDVIKNIEKEKLTDSKVK